MPAPNWIVRKNPTTATTIEIISAKTGLVQYSGTELYSLLSTLSASGDFLDGHNVFIKPESTTYNAGESQALFSKDVNIFGYGAVIRGGTTAHANGGAIKQQGNNKYMKIYGLTIDASSDGTGATSSRRLGTLISAGAVASGATCKLLVVKDCSLLNVYSYGISHEAPHNGTGSDPNDSTVIVESCYFNACQKDQSPLSGSLNEFIISDAAKFVRVANCVMYGNKPAYLSSKTISWSSVLMDATGYDEGFGAGFQGQDIDVVNVTAIACGITLRPFQAVHAGESWSSCRRCSVRGYTNKRRTLAYQAILVQGYDNTWIVEEANLENIWVGTGSIVTANSTSGGHSIVRVLTVRNCYIDAFDSGNCAIAIEDIDINFLILANMKTPTWAADNGPIKATATAANVTIGYLSVMDIDPTTDGNMGSLLVPSTFNVNVTVKEPLIKGQNTFRLPGGGSGTRTVRFLNNWGKQTLSGDGSNVTFAIPHNLVSTPVHAHVTAGSTAARGPFSVSVGATNVNAVYATAPASGSSNVVLYWRAISG